MDTPWISAYQPKEWTLHEVPLQSDDWEELNIHLKEDPLLFVCGAESKMAADLWKSDKSLRNVLFYDVEQLWSMNFDTVYGVDRVGILKKEWLGHPVDSFVLILCKGVTNDPPFFTVAVTENKI